MLDFIKNKYDCSGCTACYSVCPKKCITMFEDERGFLYPDVKEADCIHCDLCKKVCPIHTKKRAEAWEKQHMLVAITKDSQVWENSSSGGAFTEICNTVMEMNIEKVTYVYGAVFDGLEVKHIGRKMPDIQAFQKSKYIQSNTQDCFSEIEERLKRGENVVFSGTPCQVAGLKSFLRRDWENLFTIDLICHGVGSKAVFQRFISEKSRKKNVISYRFRVKKKKFDYYERYRSEIEYADGSIESIVEDDYNQLFLNQLCLRDSCGEHCSFRTNRRWGDITIADFNGLGVVFPDLKDNRGYSTVIINSAAGERVYEQLVKGMVMYDCPIEELRKWNPLFFDTTLENKNRDAFFEDFISGMSISALRKKYVIAKKKLSFSWIKEHIPYNIKFSLKKIYRLCQGR